MKRIAFLLTLLACSNNGFAIGRVCLSSNELASQVCNSVLTESGNAIDAAIAASFALTVVSPYNASLGAGGMALVYDAQGKRVTSIDFWPTPVKQSLWFELKGPTDPEHAVTQASKISAPMLPIALEQIHTKFGHTDWHRLVQPAIDLTKKNNSASHMISTFPDSALAKPSAAWKEWQTQAQSGHLALPELDHTLQLIASEGAQAVYSGALSKLLIATLQSQGLNINVDAWQRLAGIFTDATSVTVANKRIFLAGTKNTTSLMSDWLRRSHPQSPTTLELMGDERFNSIRLTNEIKVDLNAPHTWTEYDANAYVMAADSMGNVIVMTITMGAPFGSRLLDPQVGLAFATTANFADITSTQQSLIETLTEPVRWAIPYIMFDGFDLFVAGTSTGGLYGFQLTRSLLAQMIAPQHSGVMKDHETVLVHPPSKKQLPVMISAGHIRKTTPPLDEDITVPMITQNHRTQVYRIYVPEQKSGKGSKKVKAKAVITK